MTNIIIKKSLPIEIHNIFETMRVCVQGKLVRFMGKFSKVCMLFDKVKCHEASLYVKRIQLYLIVQIQVFVNLFVFDR